MNRRMVFTGAIPQDLDWNQNMQFAMVAHGFLVEAIMGMSSWAYGLAPSATPTPSLTISLGRGALGQESVVEATNPGSSAIADTADALMKVGINLTGTALTFVPPSSSGQSQVFLIQGQMQEVDGGSLVLPYYNATTPLLPFSGPNNTGASNSTIRSQTVALQVVAGAPAATGSQMVPAATIGWVPLYTVTLANGQTTITAAQVIQHPAAPFIPFTLPQLTPGASRMQRFAVSGTWTAPANVTRARAKVRAPGGGGGGTSGAQTIAGAGAGGDYSEGWTTVIPGTIYNVVVGTPGQGGQSGANGTAGTASSFNGIVAAAGQGGTGTSTANTQVPGGAAGSGSAGTDIVPGIPGGPGYIAGSSYVGGNGGGGGLGSGSIGPNTSSGSVAIAGSTGSYPGGGGNGGVSGGGGGNGGAGSVVLEW